MNRRVFFLVLSLCAFFLSHLNYAAGTTPPVLDESILNKIQNEVSGSICFEHIRKLTTLHRIWGSKDYHQAAQYLIDKAVEYGLKEATIEKYPIKTGKENFWMHSTGGYVPWDCQSGELRLISPYPMLISNYESAASTVAIGSRSTNTTAEVVYVGRGDTEDDYKGKDLSGKLALAEDGRHEKVHELAVHRFGALGTIQFFNTQGNFLESEGIYWGRILPWNKDRSKESTFGFNISTTQGRFLKGLLQKGEKVILSASIDAQIVENGFFELATAVIPGSQSRGEEFIFYAHLDHPKPGAHDNASGDAVLLEIARTLSSLINKKIIPSPTRSIRFMWIPHMSGLNMYFFSHQDKIGKVKGGCNVDCVGVNQSKFPSKFYIALPPHSLYSVLADIANNLTASFNYRIDHAINEGESEDLLFSPEGSRNLFSATLVPYQGGSDEYTANTTSLNIPSLYFFDDPLPPRHNQINFLDYIDPTNLRRISFLGAIISYAFVSAGEGMAPCLLNEIIFQEENRLKRELLKAKYLIEKSSPEDAQNNFVKGDNLLLWGKKREIRIGNSIKGIIPLGSALKPSLSLSNQLIESTFVAAKNELKREYKFKCHQLNVKPAYDPPSTRGASEDEVIPVLNNEIKGSPGYFSNYFEDLLGADFLRKYKGLRPSFRYGNVGYYETLNYIDGQNTISDIYKAVQAELWSEDYSPYHSLTFEEMANYLQMLKDAHVLNFKYK